MCSDGFLGLWIEHDCQPDGRGIFPTAQQSRLTTWGSGPTLAWSDLGSLGSKFV
jgi:hypothetical protein